MTELGVLSLHAVHTRAAPRAQDHVMSPAKASATVALAELWRRTNTGRGAADAVHATLREAVLGNLLAPGSTVTEEELARTFGVSRTPIREAVLRLEGERLVERPTGRRILVPAISEREVLEIYDVRIALDTLAAELAARSAISPDVAQLRWLNDSMVAAGKRRQYDDVSRLSLEFHEGIARASGNAFLLGEIKAVHDRVRRFDRSTLQQPGRLADAAAEHAALIDAIESGSVKRAASAARTHWLQAKQIRLSMVST